MLTVSAGVNVPKAHLNKIRETIPETREMTPGRVLRYSLARTIGMSHAEAMKACEDPRKGTPRDQIEYPHVR